VERILQGNAWTKCHACSAGNVITIDEDMVPEFEPCKECKGSGLILDESYAQACMTLGKPIPEEPHTSWNSAFDLSAEAASAVIATWYKAQSGVLDATVSADPANPTMANVELVLEQPLKYISCNFFIKDPDGA
jgi:hypothetical protein